MREAAIFSFLVMFIAAGLNHFKKAYEPKRLPIVEGYFQPEFMKLAMMLRNNMELDLERGGSVAVYHNGELVVDMWMGYADVDARRRWRNETTTLSFGTGSAAVNVVIALLVDKGVLNVSLPISHYWPDFGTNGKQDITVLELLQHKIEFEHGQEQISLRDIQINKPHIEQKLASFSHRLSKEKKGIPQLALEDLYLDSLIRRVDMEGRDIATIFNQDIARPWGIEFDMRLRKEDLYKTARLHPELPWRYITGYLPQILTSWSTVVKLFENWIKAQPLEVTGSSFIKELTMPVTVWNDYELREINLPSISGTGNARGLAKLYSILTTSRNHGDKHVLSQGAVGTVLEKILETGGRGIGIDKGRYSSIQDSNIYGHTGFGGQLVFVDPQNRLSVAYLSSYLSLHSPPDDPRLKGFVETLYPCLDLYTHRLKQSGG